ncbi:MAG: hypothetical protein IPG45_36065 [Deltaproteobacteria bacterium]|nr:hypothetical protein [Deltaproteobacteria bacterium]
MNIYLMKKPKRINSVSVTLFVMAAGLGYLGWALIPIYWPVFQMDGIMRGACNDAYRERNDSVLVNRLVSQGRRTKLRLSPENFSLQRVPYSDEELMAMPEGPRRVNEERGKMCLITFHYEDTYTWPIIERKQLFVFDRVVEAPLETVSWKKQDQCSCSSVPTGQ